MNQIDIAQTKFCTCANLRKASRAVTQFYEEMLRPTGLRATQFTVLCAISVLGQPTITDLADTLVMDRTTLTRNLKPLEKQRLVESVSGKDRRTRMVRLTSQGHQLLAEALPLWQEAQTKMVNGLGQETTDQLLQLLSNVVGVVRSD